MRTARHLHAVICLRSSTVNQSTGKSGGMVRRAFRAAVHSPRLRRVAPPVPRKTAPPVRHRRQRRLFLYTNGSRGRRSICTGKEYTPAAFIHRVQTREKKKPAPADGPPGNFSFPDVCAVSFRPGIPPAAGFGQKGRPVKPPEPGWPPPDRAGNPPDCPGSSSDRRAGCGFSGGFQTPLPHC